MKSCARLFTFHAWASLVAFSHTAIAADSSACGKSVAAQRDGKIVVAGYAAEKPLMLDMRYWAR